VKRFWTNAAQMSLAVCLGILLSPVAVSVGWEWRNWVLH
jgi:nucleoside permease NupC